MAFEALPDTVDERYFRGDSACYETDLLQWLSAEDRHSEPGGRIGFAVNAAWLKLTALSYNVASAIRGLCLNGQERTARFKRYPLLMVHVAGRMNRAACVMRLRLCASEQVTSSHNPRTPNFAS